MYLITPRLPPGASSHMHLQMLQQDESRRIPAVKEGLISLAASGVLAAQPGGLTAVSAASDTWPDHISNSLCVVWLIYFCV